MSSSRPLGAALYREYGSVAEGVYMRVPNTTPEPQAAGGRGVYRGVPYEVAYVGGQKAYVAEVGGGHKMRFETLEHMADYVPEHRTKMDRWIRTGRWDRS